MENKKPETPELETALGEPVEATDAQAELPKTFGQRFAEIAKEHGSPVAAWVLVKKDGLILMGGHKQLGQDILEGLKIVLDRRRGQPKIVSPHGGLALPQRPVRPLFKR